MRSTILIVFVSFLAYSCQTQKKLSKTIMSPIEQPIELSEIQKEKDQIFLLLTYALVYKDWQAESVPRFERRGYNIGTVLVNQKNEPVYVALNAINATDNATQHGEVRAITGYLDKNGGYNLKDFTVYTTLEPCIMCAGMITMTNVKRVVIGQKDFDYSHAFERLKIDTTPIGGYPPYPRQVELHCPNINISRNLDSAFQDFLENDNEKYLAKFLSSGTAKLIFEGATNEFLTYKVQFDENKETFDKALNFYDNGEK